MKYNIKFGEKIYFAPQEHPFEEWEALWYQNNKWIPKDEEKVYHVNLYELSIDEGRFTERHKEVWKNDFDRNLVFPVTERGRADAEARLKEIDEFLKSEK